MSNVAGCCPPRRRDAGGPAAAYKTVRAELKAYGGGLRGSELVALSKCDALTDDVIAEKMAELSGPHARSRCRLAAAGQGMKEVLFALAREVERGRNGIGRRRRGRILTAEVRLWLSGGPNGAQAQKCRTARWISGDAISTTGNIVTHATPQANIQR